MIRPLLLSLLLAACGQSLPADERIVFPNDPSVLEVKRDFGAKGDGVADDTAALQAGLEASSDRGRDGGTKILFLPRGTYRVSSNLIVKAAVGPWVYGESRDGVVIRLADGAATNVTAVLRTHPSDTKESSADFFMRNFRNLTIDVGRNPHADGVRWYGNNSSILKDVRVIGTGRVGINSGFLGQNGPNLVQDALVEGSFETGVRCAWSWGQTLSRVTVRNARREGVYVNSTAVGIEDLVVENTPVALWNEYPNDWKWWGGVVALTGGRFVGTDANQPAITNTSVLCARDVNSRGFKQVLHSTTAGGSVAGDRLDEYLSHPAKNLFPDAPDKSLNLPIKPEPRVPWETNLANWVCANDHGAKFGDNRDDTAAFQAAMDAAAAAGQTVVYLRGIGGGDPNWYNVNGEVRAHGSVRLVIGLGFGRVIGGTEGRFIVDDRSAPVVKFMHLQAFGGRPPIVENRSATNTLVVEGCDLRILGTGRGDIFVTDCPSGVELRSPGQRLWARQLNPEGDSDTGLVQNHGGRLWALGVKHEGRGVRFLTDHGGQTEILGLFNYAPSIATNDLRPAFDIRDAAFSAAGVREISFGNTYPVKVRERRGEDVRLVRGGGWIGWPLYRGEVKTTPSETPAPSPAPPAAARPRLPRLKVSDNRRFLVAADGKPFFWLGDTAWELFHRLDHVEAELYLCDRAAKGFNVIQAVALAELDGLSEPNRYGHLPLLDKDPARPALKPGPDNDYWDFVDAVLDMAAAKGLYVGFLPTWGKYVTSSAFDGKVDGIFNVTNALAYGQFLGTRYRDRANLVWILGGDKAPSTPEAVAIWRAMARGIALGVAGRENYDAVLMTYHTSGPGHVSDHIHDEPCLDFTSAQSSHGDLVESWRFIGKHWNRQPIKPVIDLESSYPDALIPAAWLPQSMRAAHPSTKPSNDDHARRAAYWAVFAGAFGHTYGHNSIWQMYAPPRKPILEAKLTWREALDAPSAKQMGYLRGLMESRPMLSRVPDQTLIAGDAGAGAEHIRATRGDGYALFYTPIGKPFRVRLDKLTGKQVKAGWFDPRTGQTTAAGQFASEGEREFIPPGEPRVGNDWVLLLDDPQRGLGAPRVALEPFDWRGFGGFDTYKWRGFLLCNNRWGGGNGRIWFKDHGDRWSFWTEHSDDLNGGHVKSFPHAGIGWMWGNWAPNQALPVPLGELAVAKSDWIVTLPETEPSQSYVVYYQLYTSTVPDPKSDGAKINGDLAIIIHREDFPFETWGKSLGEFDVGGRKWIVVHKAPAIGKSTYIIMVPVAPVAKREGNRLIVEHFDLKPCLDYCVAQGFYRPADYLLTIQVGWESRVLHGVLRSDDLKLTVGKKGADPVRLPLASSTAHAPAAVADGQTRPTDAPTFPLLGRIMPRTAKEIASSSWSIGGETLDRDFGVYANYKKFLGPLGAKAIRLQSGWAKCETKPGVYDFAWLDEVVNDAIAQGVQPWLEVSYGNKLYPDGGGTGLGGALPKSPQALTAWDNWVRAVVKRYQDRVNEWEVWNEPDLGPSPAEEYANFFIRTAEVIRGGQPKARIYALALAHKVPYAESFLARVDQRGKLALIDAITVHSYPNNPDETRNIDQLRAIIAQHGQPIAVRQGETGATSKNQPNFALKNLPMTETIQAKWNLRRMLAHHGKDVPFNLFTMIDLHYRWGGKLDMNYKGLLASREDQTVAYAKPAYFAAQNVFAVFDSSLARLTNFTCIASVTNAVAAFAYASRTGDQVVTLWFKGAMPSDSNSKTLVDFTFHASRFTTPVYADLRTGEVYSIPKANWSRVGDGVVLRQIPVYDSPILIAEKGVLTLETTEDP